MTSTGHDLKDDYSREQQRARFLFGKESRWCASIQTVIRQRIKHRYSYSIYVYTYIYIYIYRCIYIDTYTNMHIHICAYVYISTYNASILSLFSFKACFQLEGWRRILKLCFHGQLGWCESSICRVTEKLFHVENVFFEFSLCFTWWVKTNPWSYHA